MSLWIDSASVHCSLSCSADVPLLICLNSVYIFSWHFLPGICMLNLRQSLRLHRNLCVYWETRRTSVLASASWDWSDWSVTSSSLSKNGACGMLSPWTQLRRDWTGWSWNRPRSRAVWQIFSLHLKSLGRPAPLEIHNVKKAK